MTSLSSTVSQKANQSDLTTLEGTVTSLSSTVNLKADKTNWSQSIKSNSLTSSTQFFFDFNDSTHTDLFDLLCVNETTTTQTIPHLSLSDTSRSQTLIDITPYQTTVQALQSTHSYTQDLSFLPPTGFPYLFLINNNQLELQQSSTTPISIMQMSTSRVTIIPELRTNAIIPSKLQNPYNTNMAISWERDDVFQNCPLQVTGYHGTKYAYLTGDRTNAYVGYWRDNYYAHLIMTSNKTTLNQNVKLNGTLTFDDTTSVNSILPSSSSTDPSETTLPTTKWVIQNANKPRKAMIMLHDPFHIIFTFQNILINVTETTDGYYFTSEFLPLSIPSEVTYNTTLAYIRVIFYDNPTVEYYSCPINHSFNIANSVTYYPTPTTTSTINQNTNTTRPTIIHLSLSQSQNNLTFYPMKAWFDTDRLYYHDTSNNNVYQWTQTSASPTWMFQLNNSFFTLSNYNP